MKQILNSEYKSLKSLILVYPSFFPLNPLLLFLQTQLRHQPTTLLFLLFYGLLKLQNFIFQFPNLHFGIILFTLQLFPLFLPLLLNLN